MKVDPLAALTTRAAAGTAQLLLFRGDDDFSARLTLGQIIKGRVLRSYGDQCYAVEFDGQRKVVDSAVPLTNGEIVRGRVVGLGEQVTLRRVDAQPAAADSLPPAQVPVADAGDSSGAAIAALFDRYRASIDAAELRSLQQLAARSAAPEQAALAGLVLNKLGLQLAPEFLRAVHGALLSSKAAFALPPQALSLGSTRAAVDHDTPALADWLSRAVIDVPEARLREARGDTDGFDAGADAQGEGGEHDLARWILNTQTGGAVAHRVATLPLLLDGELVELDVALFAQSDDRQQRDGTDGMRHRELVFALNTAELGLVEVRALLADGHLKLRIVAESSATTERLSEHAETLADGLRRIGLEVDEQRYESRVASGRNGVLASVVEHLISPGSVSRLV